MELRKGGPMQEAMREGQLDLSEGLGTPQQTRDCFNDRNRGR